MYVAPLVIQPVQLQNILKRIAYLLRMLTHLVALV
jgi:hypothetical protein